MDFSNKFYESIGRDYWREQRERLIQVRRERNGRQYWEKEKKKFLEIQQEKEFQNRLELLSIKNETLQGLQQQPMQTEKQQPMLVHEHKQLKGKHEEIRQKINKQKDRIRRKKLRKIIQEKHQKRKELTRKNIEEEKNQRRLIQVATVLGTEWQRIGERENINQEISI